jgi:outer membrane protein
VKVAEGALYPSVQLQGNVQKNYETALNQLQSFTASIGGQLSVPLYQGGAEYAAIRQAKETQGQRQLDLNVARDQVRMNVAQAWAQLDAAKSSIESTKNQVKAAESALNGVREEARLGQRTTLDVLNAQQELVTARVAMVTAQRDRLVDSYALLASVGRLSPRVLGLQVPNYDPMVHYHQVRDAWTGLRTPDGR